MDNNQKCWVDGMIDVLKTKLRSKSSEPCRARIIRSSLDPNIGTVVMNDTLLFCVNGIGSLSDKELNDVKIDIVGTGNNRKVRVRFFRPLNPEFTPIQQPVTSSKINLPNQNYLSLRKSRF